MPIGAANYRQICTYWGSPTQGGFGDITFGDPELLKCRWEESTETFTNAAGEDQTSRAIVWTYNKLEVGGYLAKGDSTTEADPTQVNTALVIARSDELPDLRGLNMERRAFL